MSDIACTRTTSYLLLYLSGPLISVVVYEKFCVDCKVIGVVLVTSCEMHNNCVER